MNVCWGTVRIQHSPGPRTVTTVGGQALGLELRDGLDVRAAVGRAFQASAAGVSEAREESGLSQEQVSALLGVRKGSPHGLLTTFSSWPGAPHSQSPLGAWW